MSAREAVALRSITKVFPGEPPIHVLRSCSARVLMGEFVAILGPSGSGKSTLLNILGLLDAPTTGEYSLIGRDVVVLTERERTALRAQAIGFVFQSFHLLPHYTALENVALGAMYGRHYRRRRREELAGESLAAVGLSNRMTSYPGTLSGGESQRVAIARAIVKRPQLLLCDEPTGNLDSESTIAILRVLTQLSGSGLCVLTVTHDPEVAQEATRRLTIQDGILQEEKGESRRSPATMRGS